MKVVGSSNCFPKAQGVIDDGLAADRPRAGPYTRGANGLTPRACDSKYLLRRSSNSDRNWR